MSANDVMPEPDSGGGPASAEEAEYVRRKVMRQRTRKCYLSLVVIYYLVSVYSASASSSTSEHTTGEEHSTAQHEGLNIAKVDFQEVETPFIIALWIFCASLAKIGFHMIPKASHVFPESCLLIVVGLVIGLLLYKTNSVHVSPFTSETFFHYMLPPIILDAGYFMPNRLFFNNLGTILLMAVVGTLWNTFAIGLSLWGLGQANLFGVELPLLQSLLFSALISAVDPVAVLAVFEEIHVNEVLYIVVFGESLLNDAVTVVLYHMFEEYAKMGESSITVGEIAKGVASFPVVALGGTLIGVLWGFLTGFITRFTNHVRVIEPIFIFVMAYLSYLCAETFHMSGILAVTFCGITMKNYVEANISYKSHTTVKYAMKMLSSSSETIIFMFLGVSTISDLHEWNWAFVIATITFCTFHRVIGVIVLSAIANRFRLHKLGKVDQFVMSYGGLRGAVAFALVLLIQLESVNGNDKLLRMFVTTTIAVIYFTVFLQGITIKPLVVWLKVKRAEKRKPTMNERIHERLFDHTMAALESLMGQVGHYNLRDKFKQFDNAYIRPCLIRDQKGPEPKILETYSKLTMREAMNMMNSNPNAASNKLPPDSVAEILRNEMNGPGGSSGNLEPLDQGSFNIDLKELEYSLTRKDMSDAKIHHLLAEELYKPYRRHRRLSYSRHAVHENDLVTDQQPVNYKTQMNFKRMVSEKALKNGKQRKTGVAGLGRMDGANLDGNGFGRSGEVYDNPAFSISDERLQRHENDSADGDGGIYFIAGNGSRVSPARRMTIREDDGATQIEMVPPWRRDEEEEPSLRQNEFPAWTSNKEYMAYNSPTNTFLGGLDRNQQRMPTVIGLFKRDSISSAPGSRRGSIQSMHYLNPNRLESPRQSIGADGNSGHPDVENVILNNLSGQNMIGRRGSAFMAVSIPEIAEETDRDVFEAESQEPVQGGSSHRNMAPIATVIEAEVTDDDNGNPPSRIDHTGPGMSAGRNPSENKSNERASEETANTKL